MLAASVVAFYAGLSEWPLPAALSPWPAHVLILSLLLLSACLPVYSLMRQYRKTLERQAQGEDPLARERNMLRTLIDNLPDFIFVKDRESHFLMLNQAMSRLVGKCVPAIDALLGYPIPGKRSCGLLESTDSIPITFTTTSSKTIRISSREVLELLAGAIGSAEFDRSHSWGKVSAPHGPSNPFASALARGQMIASVAVIDGEDHDDDWLEFRLGEPDPAISPFQRK